MKLDQLHEAISAALPAGLAEDLRNNARAAVRSTLDRMDLVTREEFEVQERVLQRTREKLEALEKQVASLEHERKS